MTVPAVTVRETCRACGSKNLTSLFSLGEQFVSDFVTHENINAGIRCPIELELCHDCTLVQAKYTAPQDLLYKGTYWYRSGVSQTMRDALADVAWVAQKYLEEGDTIVDIGANDGTFLSHFDKSYVTVAVEPAKNMHQYYQQQDERIADVLVDDFWSAEAYWQKMPSAKWVADAKVITALGMFYDLEDPNQFIEDVAKVLHQDGVFIAQLMCLKNMIDSRDVGNLAHEHLEFYSIRSLRILLAKYGLEIFDICKNEVNGGSYRLFIRHKGSIIGGDNTNVWAAEEGEIIYRLPEFYADWFAKLETNRDNCRDFIERVVKIRGRSVWAYGASTKGNVILQWYSLDKHLIQGASDRTPQKHGLYTIGTGIPIYSEEGARAVNPNFFLVLPYAFIKEFYKREKEWREKGGQFLVPLPKFQVI